MEETNTPMFKSARPMESQMDEILSESKDPVSGNTAPVGAMPAEVRDDIPIMASPNEFMIDAATRRYYGTEFFEGLQDAAKQGFQRIKKGEESFFRDDELEVEEAAQKVSSGGSPQQMQEGGEVEGIEGRVIPAPVGGGYGGYGGTGSIFTGFEFKIYIDPTTGREIQIIFFNGRPLSPIPDGFVLKADIPVEAQEQKRIADDDPTPDPRDKFKTWKNKQAQEWSVQDFKQYAEDMSKLPSEQVGVPNPDENSVVNLLGNILGGKNSGFGQAANKLINRSYRQKANNINNEINKMLKSGLDADGNPLTDETNNILFQAQFAAQQTDNNLGGMSMTGTPIDEQKFYQTPEGPTDDNITGIDFDALMPPEIDLSSIPEPTDEEKEAAQKIIEENKPF
jgi:hypothetical protein